MIRLGTLLFAIAVPLSATLLGCVCDDFVITEEFEDFCSGSPCTWGASGPVSRVPTYHAEIHGVSIPTGTTLTANESFGMFVSAEVLARCDVGATLQVNGRTLNAPSDSYAWLSAPSGENTVISVSGTGQCTIDDVGFVDFCYD